MSDELPSVSEPTSPAPTSYDDIRALLKLLDIRWQVRDVHKGKTLRAVRLDCGMNNRYIEWQVEKTAIEKMTPADSRLAKCGAVEVWWWAIGLLIEKDENAIKLLVAAPPGPKNDAAGLPEPTLPADLPEIGATSRGRRLGPFPSGHRRHHGAARDNCATQPEC